ncbi:MAG: four helix bundle protein [Bacteroidota bacterium]
MTHKDLKVWQLSVDLVLEVYKLSKELPSDEKFGLISQIKRSSVSVPSNIAEGAGRGSNKEFVRFINIASGSLSELETQLIIIQKLEYYDTSIIVDEIIVIIRKMLYKLKQSLLSKQK